MFLTYDEELARSDPRPPFANATEGYGWLTRWCETCVHERNCPLIDLAMFEAQTPFGWIEADQESLPYRYVCAEYQTVAPTEPTEATQ